MMARCEADVQWGGDHGLAHGAKVDSDLIVMGSARMSGTR